MKLGILSDSHNEIGKTKAALALFKSHQVDQLIHCGDVTRPDMMSLFTGWKTAFVYGNVDRDRAGLLHAVRRIEGPYFAGLVYEAELNGLSLGVCHGHDVELLEAMIASRQYDLICHGHSHTRLDKWEGATRVINPGALGGRYSEPRSVCVFDITSQIAEFFNV